MAEGLDPKPKANDGQPGDYSVSQSQRTHQGNVPTLITAMEALYAVRAKWYNVGLCLEVDEGTLDAIRAEFTDSNDRLREMLRKWLKSKHPTWQFLIKALRSPIVDEAGLSDTLEQRYLSPVARPKRKEPSSEPAASKKYKRNSDQAEVLAERNLGIIKGKFASLLTDTHRELQKNLSEERIKDLHLFATSFFESATAIPESTELRQIFGAITRNKFWDYRNYYPLQVIVEKFGGSVSTQMKGWLEAYVKDLSAFQVATKIEHYIAITQRKRSRSMSQSDEALSPEQRDPQFISELSWKLEEEVADYTLDYLEDLWKSFIVRSSLPPLTVLLDTVQEGCISVTWLIRSSLAIQLMDKADDLVSFFQKHPFLTVHINGKCIYESQPPEKRKEVFSEPTEVISDHLRTPPRSPHHTHGRHTPPTASSSRQAGYECEFVDPPPEAFQTKCPICLNILCDPHETDCCGNNFCQTCIEQVQEPSCPMCKKQLTLRPNMGLKRSLRKLPVRCTHQESGCNWVGELGEYDLHLNSIPRPGELLTGCEYNEIRCEFKDAGCDTQLPRKEMAIHMKKKQTHHIELLSEKLDQLNTNLETKLCNVNHRLSQVTKKLSTLKVRVEMKQKEVQEAASKLHSKNKELAQVRQHFQEVSQKNGKEVGELKLKLNAKDTQLEKLELQLQEKDEQLYHIKEAKAVVKQTLDDSGSSAKGESPEPSVVQKPQVEQTSPQALTLTASNVKTQKPIPVNYCFTVENFESRRKHNEVFYSEPFFTHPQGYKMCAQVYPNGFGKAEGTHVTMSTCIVRGEYDDQLLWPFRGDILVQLLNQTSDKDEGHHEDFIHYNNRTPNNYAGKKNTPFLNSRNPGWGHAKFISHRSLKKYLKDDCLKFRIHKVHMDTHSERRTSDSPSDKQSYCRTS